MSETKPVGFDQEITLSRRGQHTTIRQEHQNGKVYTSPHPESPRMNQPKRWAVIRDDDGNDVVSVRISEAGFKYLRGET